MNLHLDAIGLVVDDIARSLAFYRQLGFDLPAEADQQPHVEVAMPGGLRLLWDTVDTVRSFDPDWQPPTGGGHRVALAFACDTPTEVDAAYDKLVSLGYRGHQAPWDAVWGQRYAIVEDPDGNAIDLFAPNG
ncbi:MAG: VOC family protein [Acidimicrobiales bacterium]